MQLDSATARLLEKPAGAVTWKGRKPPRAVANLVWAKWSDEIPHGKQRLTGRQALGHAYEKKVHKQLELLLMHKQWKETELLHGRWIRFFDENGYGWAQPDFVLLLPQISIIIDAKLTHSAFAHAQITALYQPLIQFIHPRLFQIGVEVCHNLSAEPLKDIIYELSDVFCEAKTYYVWHWMGR